jgi:hypothetical protein
MFLQALYLREFRTPLGGNKPGQAVIHANNGQPWRLLAAQ